MPRDEVSNTMLWVFMIWSYSVSITGAACWNRNWLCSRTASISPLLAGP